MLFDLSKDMAEVHNISDKHPVEHKKLYDEMMGYFKKVGARIPKLNPDYGSDVDLGAKEHAKRVAWGPFKGRRPLDQDER
jgi:hypothetical protein